MRGLERRYVSCHTRHMTLIHVSVQFQIRLCAALQQKPPLSTPHFDLPSTEPVLSKPPDPFDPPYNPNLFLGELKDEEEGLEYAVLVSIDFPAHKMDE